MHLKVVLSDKAPWLRLVAKVLVLLKVTIPIARPPTRVWRLQKVHQLTFFFSASGGVEAPFRQALTQAKAQTARMDPPMLSKLSSTS